MTDIVQTAREFARRAHEGQTDIPGRPITDHLEAVAGILLRDYPDAPASAVAAAWLHDVIEDTDATPETLVSIGMPGETVRLVQGLTRPEMTYKDWMRQIAGSGDAWLIRIKLADNEHNSDPSRNADDDDATRQKVADMRKRRYEPARRVLLEGLAAIGEAAPAA